MTQQVLPNWLSYSQVAGQDAYTIVQLPQTYYGPSIPLGEGWNYGGLTSPTSSAESSTSSARSTASSSSNTIDTTSTSQTRSTSSSMSSSTSSTSSSSTTTSSTSTSTTSTTSSTSTSTTTSSTTSSPNTSSSSTIPAPSSSTTSASDPAGGAGSGSDNSRILAIVLPVVLGTLMLLLLLLLALCLYRRRKMKDIERRQFEITPFLATHQTRPSDADAALYKSGTRETQSSPSTWFALLGGKLGSWGSRERESEKEKEKKFTTLPPPRSRGFKTDLSIEEKITPVQRHPLRNQSSHKTFGIGTPLLDSSEEESKHRRVSRAHSKSSIVTFDNQSHKYTSPLDKIRKMRLSMLSNHTHNDDDDGAVDGYASQPSTSAGMWGLATSLFPRRSMRPQPPLSGSVGKRVSPHKRVDSDVYSLAHESSGSSVDGAGLSVIPTPRIDDFYDNSMSSQERSSTFNNTNTATSFNSSSPSPIPPPFAFRTHNGSPTQSMSSLSQATHFSWLNTTGRERDREGHRRSLSHSQHDSIASPRSTSYNTASEGYDSSRNGSHGSRSYSHSHNASSRSRSSNSYSDSTRGDTANSNNTNAYGYTRPPVFPRTSDTVFGQRIADKDDLYDFGPPRNDYQPVIVEEDEDGGVDEDSKREEAMTVTSPGWKQSARSLLGRERSH